MQKILNVNEFYIEEYENILDIFNRMNIDTIDLKNAERDFPELYEYFKNISINYENTHASIDLIYYYSNDRIYFICDDIPPVGWYICSKEEYPEYYGFFHCLIG